jgi:hypothetical protein
MGAYSLFANPSQDFVGNGTIVSMTNMSADPKYHRDNLKDNNPANVAKATATSTTIVISGTSVTIEGFVIVNHNLYGATVTLSNGLGYSETITIPARTGDGSVINAWRDCRADSNRTASTWTLTITGASANVEIGRLYLVQQWYELTWKWEPDFSNERMTTTPKTTHYGVTLVYDRGYNIRAGSGATTDESMSALLKLLYQSAKGIVVPWIFIPNYLVNDAWYVRFKDKELKWKPTAPLFTPTIITLVECSMSLPPTD